MRTQIAVVGAGPAGLAAAINLARRGLEVVVCERRPSPPDKACGEGLLPAGVHALAGLGVFERIDADDRHPIDEIRYIDQDGTEAVGRLPKPGGHGIRRTALAEALAAEAEAAGARLLFGCKVVEHQRTAEGVELRTDRETITAELLVAADGLHSPTRRAAGLDAKCASPRRFGLRQHYRCAPRGSWVEVHLDRDVEAFLTPVGPERVGLAFLWDRDRLPGRVDFASLLDRFPRVAERIAGAPVDSAPMGAGPLAQTSRSVTANRLVLIGDAAGYVDAITGEGMSLAFATAAELGRVAPDALKRGADRASLSDYEQAQRRLFRKYSRVTRAVLALARRPALRSRAIHLFANRPGLLDWLIARGLS